MAEDADHYIGLITRDIQYWIETRDQKHRHFNPSVKNRYRLLTLRSWSLRYKLSIPDMLDMVMKPLRREVKYTPAKKSALGISVTTLVSRAAQRIIEEKLVRRYPGGENVEIWRKREQAAQLERERKDAEEEPDRVLHRSLGNIDNYASRYKRRVLEKRDFLSDQELASWRKRRRYRNNPWL